MKREMPYKNSKESEPAEWKPKRIFETKETREKAAREFIESLSAKPLKWKISGSSARGDFRPDSDIDVDGLYERDSDVPYGELSARRDPENGLIDGYIDYHYFAKDWKVYEYDPELLKKFEKTFDK